MSLPKLLVILGPTAAGKTDLAIRFAQQFDGEVISADSRQFYRGLEIAAATPAGKWGKVGRRRAYLVDGVPHHLMAFCAPTRSINVAEFRNLAARLIRDIGRRGKLPILCGGTGLFVAAVADNLQIPEVPPDWELRRRLERQSVAVLYRRLQRLDPAYAQRIPPQNRRYVIRALEVITKTGQPFSELQGRGEPLYESLKIGVDRPRAVLYQRIDRRVDQMITAGLVGEARRLLKRYPADLPALSSLGYPQLQRHFAGEISLTEAVQAIKRDTRHYAKRQAAYFKRDKQIVWVSGLAQAKKLVKGFLPKN